MSAEPAEKKPRNGYGNIYTPSAGSMIIHVQRESGLANRTIVLTLRQVHLLRRGAYVLGGLLVIVLLSWFYLATQAARVPLLQRKIESMQADVKQLDTLRSTLNGLESRFQQVQTMLGAAPKLPDPLVQKTDATLPDSWPLPVAGTVLTPYDTGSATRGMDIGVDPGTPVRAAGAGMVVELSDDPVLGHLIRIANADDYESIYANVRDVRVARGDHVAAGATIAVTGDARRALPPHLHFEVRRGKTDVNPISIMKQGPANGDLQR
ncbi:MAG TPA: M23 family metallopeptidase [Gemmatimonadaceae bacterium]|nr:M23 family metallopeptidase [Gemmatimonadaceae bacterium]